MAYITLSLCFLSRKRKFLAQLYSPLGLKYVKLFFFFFQSAKLPLGGSGLKRMSSLEARSPRRTCLSRSPIIATINC